MDLGLEGKVALVAGASRGLGRAVAEALAAEGVRLVLCARGEKQLGLTLDQISKKHGVRGIAIPTDVSDSRAIDVLLTTARKEMGRIDILVTNAGGPPAGTFLDTTPAMWEETVKLTLLSAVQLARGVLPGMRKQRWGRIINITSIAVKQPVDNLILSNSLRAAVTGFARTLANEVAAEGVTVNNVMPGFTRTQRLEELAERVAAQQQIGIPAVRAGWEKQIPMARLGEPEEFAALVAFLASQQASYITGTSIPVDGGWIKALL